MKTQSDPVVSPQHPERLQRSAQKLNRQIGVLQGLLVSLRGAPMTRGWRGPERRILEELQSALTRAQALLAAEVPNLTSRSMFARRYARVVRQTFEFLGASSRDEESS